MTTLNIVLSIGVIVSCLASMIVDIKVLKNNKQE